MYYLAIAVKDARTVKTIKSFKKYLTNPHTLKSRIFRLKDILQCERCTREYRSGVERLLSIYDQITIYKNIDVEKIGDTKLLAFITKILIYKYLKTVEFILLIFDC